MTPEPLSARVDLLSALRTPSADASTVHFARNGHSYRGGTTLPGAIASGVEPAIADEEMADAEVWAYGRVAWVVGGLADGLPTRLTAVLTSTDGTWQVHHIHRSPAAQFDRPGGI